MADKLNDGVSQLLALAVSLKEKIQELLLDQRSSLAWVQ